MDSSGGNTALQSEEECKLKEKKKIHPQSLTLRAVNKAFPPGQSCQALTREEMPNRPREHARLAVSPCSQVVPSAKSGPDVQNMPSDAHESQNNVSGEALPGLALRCARWQRCPRSCGINVNGINLNWGQAEGVGFSAT